MNFIAIDFETANEKRDSACSIGIAVVKNGQVVERIHHLIKPKEVRFLPINIGIHGITASMVKNEPEFDEIWAKIKHLFKDNIVVAHNAPFDISVLRKCAELYSIKLPNFNYICTVKLSKNFYPNLENVKLNTVSDFLGYEFKHHDALYDALACSNILLSISQELHCNDIDEIARLTGVNLGTVTKMGYTTSSVKGKVIKTSTKVYSAKEELSFEWIEPTDFKNEVVVFTGKLSSMTRDKAMRLVRELGGKTGSSVTKMTTILVSNMKNIRDLRREEMSTKFRKASDLCSRGQNIKFLDEAEFLRLGR